MIWNIITRLLEWIPGCSPCVPATWTEAALQAFTCLIRWGVLALTVYLLYRLVI